MLTTVCLISNAYVAGSEQTKDNQASKDKSKSNCYLTHTEKGCWDNIDTWRDAHLKCEESSVLNCLLAGCVHYSDRRTSDGETVVNFDDDEQEFCKKLKAQNQSKVSELWKKERKYRASAR